MRRVDRLQGLPSDQFSLHMTSFGPSLPSVLNSFDGMNPGWGSATHRSSLMGLPTGDGKQNTSSHRDGEGPYES